MQDEVPIDYISVQCQFSFSFLERYEQRMKNVWHQMRNPLSAKKLEK